METVDFTEPTIGKYTIYSKSGCKHCTRVKDLLDEHNIDFSLVDCDKYLIEQEKKQYFLQYIKTIANKEWKTFPIVFDGTQFIGGYYETFEYLEKTLDFDNDF